MSAFQRARHTLYICVSFLLLCGATQASAQSGDLRQWAHRLTAFSTLYLPDQPGPHPTVIYLHGCRRRTAHEALWGNALAAHGYAMLAIDSFTPRDIWEIEQQVGVCSGLSLRGSQRTKDLWAALYILEHELAIPAGTIDFDRIGAMGFSHGAWTIMDMMSQWTDPSQPGSHHALSVPANPPGMEDLKALVLIYPWCRMLSLTQNVGAWTNVPPTHFARPLSDTVVGANGCNQNIADLSAAAITRGQGPVEDVRIQAHGHAFDEPDGVFSNYDPEAARTMIDGVIRFLNRSL